MLVSEIREHVLVQSGNLFLGDLSMLGINSSQFLTIVRKSLSEYSEYQYWKKRIVVRIGSSTFYDFSKQSSTNWVRCAPEFISDVVHKAENTIFNQPTLQYQYEKPILKLRVPSQYTCIDVECQYKFEVSRVQYKEEIAKICDVPVIVPTGYGKVPTVAGSTTDPSFPSVDLWNPYAIPPPRQEQPRQVAPSAPHDELSDWEVEGIEVHDYATKLLDLVCADFMIAVGRSRRSFQLSDSPVIIDGADLIAEGRELRAEVVEFLHEEQDLWMTMLESPRTNYF